MFSVAKRDYIHTHTVVVTLFDDIVLLILDVTIVCNIFRKFFVNSVNTLNMDLPKVVVVNI